MTHFQRQLARYPRFDFDTETFLSQPGCQAPPLVCAQGYLGSAPGVHAPYDAPEIHHAAYTAQDWLARGLAGFTSGHNLPYDLACTAATWPELLPAVFKAVDEDRAICTLVAAKMWDNAAGALSKDEKRYGLAGVVARLAPEAGLDLDKEDPWRMRYGTLYPVRLEDWDPEARHYALQDARAQRATTDALIQAEAVAFPGVFEDLFRQTRRALWHHLITCHGVRTDRKAVEEYDARVRADWERDKAIVVEAGLARMKGRKLTKDTKAAVVLMERAWRRKHDTERAAGVAEDDLTKPVLTESGALSLNEDACDQVQDPLLSAYQRYGSLDTLLGRVAKLKAGTSVAIQARFMTPLETGRSSCREDNDKKGKPNPRPSAYGFQMQNPPSAPGLRECFIARDGYTLSSVDYDGFELKTWAQVCLWSVGYSKLAEVLNSTIDVNGKATDRDPHTELAATLAGLSNLEAYTLRAKKDSVADAWDLKFRQSAKPANFGFPGGMGALAFVDSARKMYDVTVSIPEAFELRQAWLNTWQEARDYFTWINRLGDGNPIVSFAPPGTPHGIIRGGTRYTQRCNHFFQNLAASGAGAAGWALARECYLKDGGPRGTKSPLYGSRIWGFLHDEFLLEIPEDRQHEGGERHCEVQRSVAQEWVPDVRVTCSPTLMKRWAKKAKTVYRHGKLVPWDVAA